MMAMLPAGACTDDPATEDARSLPVAADTTVGNSAATVTTTRAPATTTRAPASGRVVECPDGPLAIGTIDYAADAIGEPTPEAAVARHLAMGINDWYPPLTVDEITPLEGGGFLVTLRDDDGATSAALWVTDLEGRRGSLVSGDEVCSAVPEPGSP
jgi:hypothetical protein